MKKDLMLCVGCAATLLLFSSCCNSNSCQKTEEEPAKIEEAVAEKVIAQDTILKKTESGLQYKIVKEGDIKSVLPKVGQKVAVHYTGWLQNKDGEKGKKFDSSVDRGQSLNFVVGIGQVIKGWDEGVIDMHVGEQRQLIIPANLAYGSRGAGRSIPPNSTLIFDVELLEVI